MVSEPATMARREFDAMKFCTDAVPSILVASSYTVHQCLLVRPVAQQTYNSQGRRRDPCD